MIIVKEDKSDKYPPRTYYNAKSGDVTVAFAVDLTTAGEKLTHKAAGDKYIGFQITKQSDPIEIARQLFKVMRNKNAKTLNIAGNGIYTLSKHGWSQEDINEFVLNVVGKVHEFWRIEKIFTGGQTGVDLAGAVVADFLNINAEITLPKGFKQRFDTADITQSKEDVENQIKNGSNKLTNKNKSNFKKI
jgi:hypothetical protein